MRKTGMLSIEHFSNYLFLPAHRKQKCRSRQVAANSMGWRGHVPPGIEVPGVGGLRRLPEWFPGIYCTVNVTLPVVPFGVVTLTFLALRVAVEEMVKVAVTVVSFTTTMLLTLIPLPLT